MSKPTEQRATIVDKCRFCFAHLNLRFPLTLRRACSPFFSFQMPWRWVSHNSAKWENDYTGRKERAESIRKWQLFSCARGAGQLPGPVAKVTESSANWCSGQQLGSTRRRGGMYGEAEDDGWDIGLGERGQRAVGERGVI